MHYLLLVAAIVLECAGTYLLKVSDGFTILAPTIGSLVLYAVCYWCFSKALNGITLSVAYATWGAVSVVLATLISVVAFHEPISTVEVVGIALATVGVVVVNLGGVA